MINIDVKCYRTVKNLEENEQNKAVGQDKEIQTAAANTVFSILPIK